MIPFRSGLSFLAGALAVVASLQAAESDGFVAAAREQHGAMGENAARFLVEHMPAQDRRTLSLAFLAENLELALQARAEFPWARVVPDELFLNDVLPYAVFDEARDPWRAEFHSMASTIVKGSDSATAAAQALNREFFKRVKVRYHPNRRIPNQSPKESMALGQASCTGLAIMLVEACRAVGIPARAVGTPLWANGRGNHTWVEIWDGDWKFTGAGEYHKEGMNRGWFVGDAAKAKADEPIHAIYATSWKKDGLAFPMVWAPVSAAVGAVNVTVRYAKPTPVAPAPVTAKLGVRLFAKAGGERLVATVRLFDAAGHPLGAAVTMAGTSDLNDLPRFEVPPAAHGVLRFTIGEETRAYRFGPLPAGDATADVVWTELPAAAPASKK